MTSNDNFQTNAHGVAGQHHGERHNLIARLQNVAKTKNVRVSFVGGDVHVAGVGRLYTQPKIHRLRYDHRFMPQVTLGYHLIFDLLSLSL